MHDQPANWPDRLLRELDDADRRAITLARSLTTHQLNWRPAPNAWSIGQNLDHLATASEVYLDAIAGALRNAPVSPTPEITPGWFGRWFIRSYIEPLPKTRRARAPRKIRPRSDVDSSVLDRFLKSNTHAREVIERASRHDVNRLRFRNPLAPLIRFTVGTGLEIISAHERRHLLQAERIKPVM